VLLESLDKHLGDVVKVGSDPAGTHLIAWLPDGLRDAPISDRAAEMGISAPPLSHWAIERTDANGFVLGYTGFGPPTIRYRVKRLTEAVFAEER
jgi:GntR family transcriptional regulator/MocR family aminotransferase